MPAAATPAAQAPATNLSSVDLAFTIRGRIDTLDGVSVRAKVSTLRDSLRKRIKEALGLGIRVNDIEIFSLLQDDGSWPTEEQAPTAPRTPVHYANPIGVEFEGALDRCVHFAVRLAGDDEDVEEEGPDAAGMQPADSDKESQMKIAKRLTGSKRRLSDEEEEEEIMHMAFSDFTAARIERMYKGVVTGETFDQKTDPLPKTLEDAVRASYKTLVSTSNPPWHEENEAQKRRYIDAVLTHCIFSVNAENPDKEKLLLHPKHPIECENLRASGCADWVVTRGDRMLVVSEAKSANIHEGQYPVLAMMEAIWIENKLLGHPVTKLKAICTDFQNWMFLERVAKVLRRDYASVKWPRPANSFPETLIPICEQVYNIMLNL